MELLLHACKCMHAAAEGLNLKLSIATLAELLAHYHAYTHQQTPLNAQKYTSINLHVHVTQVPL